MPNRHDLAEEGAQRSPHALPGLGAAGGAGGATGTALYLSPAARQGEAEAMAAAASPGGLSAERQLRVAGIVGAGGGAIPLEPGVPGRVVGEDGGVLAGVPERVAASGGIVDAAGVAVGVGGDDNLMAAPAAGGWPLTGRQESESLGGVHGRLGSVGSGGGPAEGIGGGGGGGGAGAGGRGGRRYFGLFSRDEWISASSSRIEKLNSRAPWKNCWTEEAPVNDSNDPYLADDGTRLVFAVPRAPVDGAPCLVSGAYRLPLCSRHETRFRFLFVGGFDRTVV